MLIHLKNLQLKASLSLIALLLITAIMGPFTLLWGQEQSSSHSSNFQITPTLLFTTSQVYRGALVWEHPLLFAAATITAFNFIQLGNGLTFYKQLNEQIKISLSFAYFDDNPPSGYAYRFSKRPANFRNRRQSSVDSSIHLNWKPGKILSFNALYSKELIRYWGDYVFAKINASLIPFTTFSVGAGWGTQKTNNYIFGEGAQSGLTHLEYEVSLFLPFLPWNGSLRSSYTLFQTIHGKNKNASYVLPTDHPDSFKVMAFWPIHL